MHSTKLRAQCRQLSTLLSISVLLLLPTLLLATPGLAQSKQKKRPKLKDFGSSLKRLTWDPNKNTAVEVKRNSRVKTSEEDDVIRIETNLVTCDILVVDERGNIVKGLKAEDFSVTEDGESQQVGHFMLGDNASIPRTIVLIIDYSGSQFPYLRNSIDAAKRMVDKLGPLDVMAIVTDDVELLIDFTNDKSKLKEKLESLEKRVRPEEVGWFRSLIGVPSNRRFGRSAQYSALMATLNEAFIEEDLRPIIVFQTDGDEIYDLKNPIITPRIQPDLPEDLRMEAMRRAEERAQSALDHGLQFSLADIYRAVERSRATIYTVVPGYKFIGRSDEEQISLMKNDAEKRLREAVASYEPELVEKIKADYERWRYLSPLNLAARAKDSVIMQTALAAVAPRTGGWTEFLETPDQAEGIYTRIMSDISQRYIVGYYPSNKERDGKRRRIKFEVKGHPDYHIFGRTSYYAPSQ